MTDRKVCRFNGNRACDTPPTLQFPTPCRDCDNRPDDDATPIANDLLLTDEERILWQDATPSTEWFSKGFWLAVVKFQPLINKLTAENERLKGAHEGLKEQVIKLLNEEK